MPRRAKIATLLPQELRKELNTKMIANAFAGYTPLSEWLAGHGYKISKSSINRYGRKLESRIWKPLGSPLSGPARSWMARYDEGAMNEALMRLVQKRLFDVLMEDDSIDTGKLDIGEVATMVVTVGRANIDQKGSRRRCAPGPPSRSGKPAKGPPRSPGTKASRPRSRRKSATHCWESAIRDQIRWPFLEI